MRSNATGNVRLCRPARRRMAAILLMQACSLLPVSARALDVVIGSEPIELALHVDRVDGPVTARAHLWHDASALLVRVTVNDPDLVFAPDTEHGDHLRLWLAPPPNRFSDQPEQHFHSALLNQRYWIPPELTETVLTTGGWLGDEHFFADRCVRGEGDDEHVQTSEELLTPAPVALGVFGLDINPYGRQVRVRECGWADRHPLQGVADAVVIEQFELHKEGYALTLRLRPAALGLVPVSGVDGQRLAIDVVAFDEEGNRTVATSAPRERDDDASVFQRLRLAQVLPIEVDARLPFLGRPWSDLPASRKALAVATPPYLIWNGQQWMGASLGPGPGTERGEDLCSAELGGGLLRYEASFVPQAITYQPHPVPGRLVETYLGGIYIDGEPVDLSFGNTDFFASDHDLFRPQIREAFAVDAETVALLIDYGTRVRGRFARGPCAAGTIEHLDLVLWTAAGHVRHPLVAHSSCSGPSIGDERLPEDELAWDAQQKSVSVDAAGRAIVLGGTRKQYLWRVLQSDSGWAVEHEVRALPNAAASAGSAATRLLADMDSDPALSQAERHRRLLAVLDADRAGLGEHELDNTVCAVAKGLSLRRKVSIVQRLGHTPACLLRHSDLIEQIAPDRAGVARRMADIAHLVETWQPPHWQPIHEVLAHLEGAQRLHAEGRTIEAESALAIAALLARRAGGFPAQRRHLDTLWLPIEHGLLTTATTQTWDFVLEHSVDPAARDSRVEYWLAEYARRDDLERLDHLMHRHVLPDDAYRYLLLLSADRPHLQQRLLARGVRDDDRLGNGDTLLHLLVQHVYATPEQIARLLANGVGIDQVGEEGETALQRLYRYRSAFYQGDAERLVELAQSLIDAGADVRRPHLLSRALHLDARHGRSRPLHFSAPLLAAGADPERIDEEGDSALRHAIRNELTWLIEPLLAAGVEVDSVGADGRTALMLALFNGQTETARLLLSAGADRVHRDAAGHDACDHLGLSIDPATLDPAIDHALRKALGCLQRAPLHRPALWQPAQPGCGQDRFAFSARRDQVWSVYSVDREGGDVRLIGGARTDRPQRLRVARGSNLIAWQEGDGIHVATCTGEDARRVTTDGMLMAWYPDGDRLLIAKWLGSALCTLYRDGSTRCSPAHLSSPNADLSGDGQTLVVSAHTETPSLLRLGPPRSARALLERDSLPYRQSNGHARFLPDGETVSMISTSPGQPYQLRLWRPDTGIGETVLEGEDPDRHLWHYAWSADAATLALIPFSFARVGQPPQPAVLKLFDRTLGQVRALDLGFESYSEVDWFW